MKLLLLPLLLIGAGLGGYGLHGGPTDRMAARPDAAECRVALECTERNTCIVTCFDAAGEVRCRQEIACDRPCPSDCESPCEAVDACRTR